MIDKCLYHCQPEYRSPHSYSRMCKIWDKAWKGRFWYGSCPPVSLLSVGMCGNSYYDISLPEMISLPSLCSNLISAPFYGIQLAISFNFTIRENKKERTPPSFLVRQQQDRSKVSARWKHSFTFMHTEYKI